MPQNIKQVAEIISQTIALPIWEDDGLVKLYLYCLCKASHNTFRWKGLLIHPGDIPLSLRNTAESLSWSREKLYRKIKQLSAAGLITMQSYPFKGSMIHVEKWPHDEASFSETGIMMSPVMSQNEASFSERYETDWSYNEASYQEPCHKTRPVLSQNQASLSETGLMMRHNPKEEKKNTSTDTTEPTGFTEIWLSYPVTRRNRRSEAASLVRTALTNGATKESILEALESDKQSSTWQQENGRFIPGIVNWLQKEAWRGFIQSKTPEEEELWTTR